MSPQEAAELMRDFSEDLCVPDHTTTRRRFREAVSLAIAALEREAKAEPVARKPFTLNDEEWARFMDAINNPSPPTQALIDLMAKASPPQDPPASQVRDIPEGWVMVPRKPTKEMLEAAFEELVPAFDAMAAFRAMLAASPPAPESE